LTAHWTLNDKLYERFLSALKLEFLVNGRIRKEVEKIVAVLAE
jgi:hypothetical protein